VRFFRIYHGVHDLEQIVSQLEQLEEIQTSIELAKFHHLKGVTIQLPDSLGHDHNHTLLINGHDRNTKALMNVVIEERERLRDTLLKKIKELDKHGTTQLRPDLAMKEVVECSTMRVRGQHFAPLPHDVPAISEDCNAVIKTNDFDFHFAGESDTEEGADE
jgi:DNA polymerase II large subunit